jgi:hypothetical protein
MSIDLNGIAQVVKYVKSAIKLKKKLTDQIKKKLLQDAEHVTEPFITHVIT